MADVEMIRRRSVLTGMSLPAKEGIAAVSEAGPASRFIYRGAAELLPAVFGVALPTTPMRAESHDGRAALWLGPDEWLLLAPAEEGPSMRAAFSDALHGQAVSLVDVGHRQVGLVVAGPRAADVLNAGCPLDLDTTAFPVGMCTRTILAKAEIVLWRPAAESFRLEVTRSFAPYVVEFLREALHGVS